MFKVSFTMALIFITLYLGCGGNGSVEPDSNQPPAMPSNPSPEDNATDVPTDFQISWHCSDPDGDSILYNIYFGTNDNPPLVVSDNMQSNYSPELMEYETEYYWRIEAKDETDTTTGPVWSFQTISDNDSYTPYNPSPANGSQNQSTRVTLHWNCSNQDTDSLKFRIDMGHHPDSLYTLTDNLNQNSFDPGALNPNTTYYWMVTASDESENTVNGPVWNFTTVNSLSLVGHYYTPSLAWSVYVHENYAFVLCTYSTEVLDISDPSNPTFITRYLGNDMIYCHMQENYVYSLGSDSLKILDVSDIRNPVLLGSCIVGVATNLKIVGDYGYLIHWFIYPYTSEFRIYDLSEPSNPNFISTFDPFDDDHINGYSIINDYAYLSWDASDILHIVDVSNPQEPSQVISYPIDGVAIAANSHHACISTSNGLSLLDISNPDTPVLSGDCECDGKIRYVDDAYAYLNDIDHLSIIDISDASLPEELLRYEACDHIYNIDVNLNYIYMAVEDSGLVVLEFNP